MVGDGATDLEARQPGGADVFIGYASEQLLICWIPHMRLLVLL